MGSSMCVFVVCVCVEEVVFLGECLFFFEGGVFMGGREEFIGERVFGGEWVFIVVWVFIGEWVFVGGGCLWVERRSVYGEVCIYGRWTCFWRRGVKGGEEERGEERDVCFYEEVVCVWAEESVCV